MPDPNPHQEHLPDKELHRIHREEKATFAKLNQPMTNQEQPGQVSEILTVEEIAKYRARIPGNSGESLEWVSRSLNLDDSDALLTSHELLRRDAERWQKYKAWYISLAESFGRKVSPEWLDEYADRGFQLTDSELAAIQGREGK